MGRVDRLRREARRVAAAHLEPDETAQEIALVMEGPNPSWFALLGAPFAFPLILYRELSGSDSFLFTLAAALLIGAGYLIGLLGFERYRALVLTERRVLFLGADWRWRFEGLVSAHPREQVAVTEARPRWGFTHVTYRAPSGVRLRLNADRGSRDELLAIARALWRGEHESA